MLLRAVVEKEKETENDENVILLCMLELIFYFCAKSNVMSHCIMVIATDKSAYNTIRTSHAPNKY